MNGENVVEVTVTNTDGETTVEHIYTVTVTKPVPTTLSGLTISGVGTDPVALTPEFNADTLSYSATAPVQGEVTATPTSEDAVVTFGIDGTGTSIADDGFYNLGSNETANITVTVSGAGSQDTIYTIAVTAS